MHIPGLKNFGLRKEVYIMVENLSDLLTSGMSIITVLDSIASEVRTTRLRKRIYSISKQVQSGSTLASAFAKEDLLPPRMITLIRIGEKTGKLSENLKVLVLQNQKDEMFRSKVRSSLLYTTIIMVLTVLIGGGTAWYVLPKLTLAFEQFDVVLPLPTRIMLWFGTILSRFGYIIMPLVALILINVFYFLFSFPRTKFIGHRILFHVPLIKTLIRDVEIARFGFILGTMVQAGVPIVPALEALIDTTTYKNYQALYSYLAKSIGQGKSFRQCFHEYPGIDKLFPNTVTALIMAGELSGNLDKQLLHIGERYERFVDEVARNLPIIIEPILIVGVGIAVAFLGVSIIYPIYQLADSI
ncbi:MAG: type II secretion system F family protein [Patescibacteria group bacterium]|jgi:type IV pilus assembly protein PilC